MINLDEPRHPKKPRSHLGFIGASTCVYGLIELAYKDEKGIFSVVFGLYMIFVYFLARKSPVLLRRGLVITGFLGLGLVYAFFGPDLEMQASQARTSVQRGNVKAQSGHIIRILDVSIESKSFAHENNVHSYQFELRADGIRYRDQTTFWVARSDHNRKQSCLEQNPEIAPNASITCQVAFEIPLSVRSGKLVYDGSDYKARADVSF